MLTADDLDAMSKAVLARGDNTPFASHLERAIRGQGTKYPESEVRHQRIVSALVGLLGLQERVEARIAERLPLYPGSTSEERYPSSAEWVVNSALGHPSEERERWKALRRCLGLEADVDEQ